MVRQWMRYWLYSAARQSGRESCSELFKCRHRPTTLVLALHTLLESTPSPDARGGGRTFDDSLGEADHVGLERVDFAQKGGDDGFLQRGPGRDLTVRQSQLQYGTDLFLKVWE
jgi:hypothetical protein